MKTHISNTIKLICLIFLLHSCSSDNESSGDIQSGNGIIHFKAIESAEESDVKSTTQVESISQPFSDDYSIECTLQKISNNEKASRTIPLKTGVKYRVLAYNTSGTLIGDKIWTVGSESSQQFQLPTGSYTFVAYTYNSTAPITDVLSGSGALSTTVSPPTDAMSYKVSLNVVDGDNYLPINFAHHFSRVVVNLNAANVDAATVTSCTATLTPGYSGTFTINNSGGSMTSTGTSVTQNVSWTNLGTQSVVSDSTIVYTNGAKPTVNFAANTLTVKRGDGTTITNTAAMNFAFTTLTLQSGYSYKLNITPKKKITILVIADLTNSHGNNPANTGFSCGYVFQKQFANAVGSYPAYDYQFIQEQSGQSSLTATAKKWITGVGNGGNRADIVYLAYQVKLTSELQTDLKNYMAAKGVVVLLYDSDTYGTTAANRTTTVNDLTTFFTSVYGTTITGGNVGAGFVVAPPNPSYGGYMRPFPGHSSYSATSAVGQPVTASDPIMSSRYNVYNLQWGEDASPTIYVTGLPTDKLYVYSTGQDVGGGANGTGVEKYITAFRYQSSTINMMFVGDGGFTGGDTHSYDITQYWRSPFAQTTNNNSTPSGVPAGRPNYGLGSHNNTAYNSYVFCNIMQWAIDRSQALRSGISN